jgi:NADH dehydrogenase
MRPGEVVVSTPNGEQCIRAATVIWTAGVRASHLGQALESHNRLQPGSRRTRCGGT